MKKTTKIISSVISILFVSLGCLVPALGGNGNSQPPVSTSEAQIPIEQIIAMTANAAQMQTQAFYTPTLPPQIDIFTPTVTMSVFQSGTDNLDWPTLKNLRLAKDEDGNQETTSFGTNDTIYVVGDLHNGLQGNIITSKWYVDKVEGYNTGYLIDSSDLHITEDGSYSVNFYFEPPADGWPTGSYNVEVYFNGVLKNVLGYLIEQ